MDLDRSRQCWSWNEWIAVICGLITICVVLTFCLWRIQVMNERSVMQDVLTRRIIEYHQQVVQDHREMLHILRNLK